MRSTIRRTTGCSLWLADALSTALALTLAAGCTARTERLDGPIDVPQETSEPPPSCAELDALEPNSDFVRVESEVEYVNEVVNEMAVLVPKSWSGWRLRGPRLDVGCVSYVAELRVQTNNWERARPFVYVCHTCSSDRLLHWWSQMRGGERRGKRNAGAHLVWLDFSMGLRLRDGLGRTRPWSCPTERGVEGCGGFNLAAPLHAWTTIPAGEVVTINSLEYLELFVDAYYSQNAGGGDWSYGGNLPFRDLHDSAHAGGDGIEPLPDAAVYPYFESPLDWSGPLALEVLLPRLWPADTPFDKVVPEKSGDVACRMAGLVPLHPDCGDRTEHISWSPNELLVHGFERIDQSEHFMRWVEEARPAE